MIEVVTEQEQELDPKFFEDVLIKFMYVKENVRDRIYPHIKPELFDRHENRFIIENIFDHVGKYDKFPTVNETRLSLLKDKDGSASDHFKTIYNTDVRAFDNKFLLNELEEFFKQKMIQNICFDIMENVNSAKLDEIGSAPDRMREALAFSFDVNIGLNLFSEAARDRLFKTLHEKKYIIPTGIKLFDEMIDGGFHDKSLSLFLAETNMGKSLIMNSLSISNVFQNKKCLYISCELSEERTAERSLANLFDLESDQLKMLSQDKFNKKYSQFIDKFSDNYVIVEYPTKSINCNDLRNLLKELDLKLKFKPDIVYLDQIENLNPIHRAKSDNTYSEMKKVTQDVRGLATESGVPWVSAIQTNRDGMSSSEIDLTNVGDSIGFAQIADLVIAVTQTEELKAAGKMIWTLLKNRFGPNKRKMTVCVNYEKMRITNDDDASVEFRSDFDTAPLSDRQKVEKKSSIINEVADIISKHDEDEDNKFLNLSDDYE